MRTLKSEEIEGPRVRLEPEARIFLQPIAAPSILGLYGLCGATFVFGAFMARWFGTTATPALLFPFAGIFGGLTQLLAAMWAYKARDGVATAMHGTWGSFWLAYGLLYGIILTGKVVLPSGTSQAMGFWFMVLAVITATGAWVSTAESRGMTITWGLLALSSITFSLGNLLNSSGLVALTGWLFFLTAIAAWYTASALMAQEAFGRPVLPMGKVIPEQNKTVLAVGLGEPGVIHGQYTRAS